MAVPSRFGALAGILATLLIATAAGAGEGPGLGTLGYGPPGLHPGFQGFGLGYRLGHGYGGKGLGVGAFGGYPRYGGPGYPTADPRTVFQPVGPLSPTQDVARIIDPGGNRTPLNFGGYTGVLPYPEAYFAPYVGASRTRGSEHYQQPPPTFPVRPLPPD